MANPDSSNVLVGKPKVTGGVLAGAVSATLPDDATSPVDAALVGLGYVSDAGLVQTIGTDTTPVTAWGGDEVRTLRTSHTVSYAVSLIETTADTLKEVYGIDNVSVAGDLTTVAINSAANGTRAYVFDMVDGDNDIRIVCPNAEVTAVGDISYVDGEPIGYDLTITCYPDDAGNKAYLYLESNSGS